MIKNSFNNIANLGLLILLLYSCTKKENDSCISYIPAPVTKVDGPNSGMVNQEIPFTVDYFCINGCGKFWDIKEDLNGSTASIKIITKYEGCVCTQALVPGQVLYNFKASQPGTYYLKFLQWDINYLMDTILIQ